MSFQLLNDTEDSFGKVDETFTDTSHHGSEFVVFHFDFDHVKVPFIVTLWLIFSSLAKVMFHMVPAVSKRVPESCLLIVIGVIVGIIFYFHSKDHRVPATLTPELFFLFMLPPIVLEAGYSMPNKLFFNNLGTILLMAVVGTIWNALTIGFSLYFCGLAGIFGENPPGLLSVLLFSSLISAVDPVAVIAIFEEIHVDETLYIVVFGESLLNDAVTVVLYNMFDTYVEIGAENVTPNNIAKGVGSFFLVALGGTFIGIIWGYILALVTRFTHHASLLEPLFVIALAYGSYLNAEMFHLSGILAVTFFGIFASKYVNKNICTNSHTTLKYAMKMLSSSSETIIFMLLGAATVHDRHHFNAPFVVLTILFCLIYRAIGVILQSALVNRYRLKKLTWVDQFVLSYGGLRGAVAFALALLIEEKRPHSQLYVTTTIAMIFWTVFVQGITVKPLVKYLHVKTSSEKDPSLSDKLYDTLIDHAMAGMEEILGEIGATRVREIFRRFDDRFIKPVVLHHHENNESNFAQTLERLADIETNHFIREHPKLVANLVQSKIADDLENMTPKKIHELLSKHLIPKNKARRLSFDSRHAVVLDRAEIHKATMLRRSSLVNAEIQKRRASLMSDSLMTPESSLGQSSAKDRRMSLKSDHLMSPLRTKIKMDQIPEVESQISLNHGSSCQMSSKMPSSKSFPRLPSEAKMDDSDDAIVVSYNHSKNGGETNLAFELHDEQGVRESFSAFRARPDPRFENNKKDSTKVYDLSEEEC